MPSKKKTPEKTALPEPGKYLVLRDNNEHEGKGWLFEASESCAGTVERNLYTGDYGLEGYYDNKLFVIERKGCVSEFVQNISTKEKWDDFKQELERLEEFRWPFVVCEFPFSLLRTYPNGSNIPRRVWPHIRVKPQFLLKRVEEIWLRFKTRFIFTDTPELGREVASGLFKRVVESAAAE